MKSKAELPLLTDDLMTQDSPVLSTSVLFNWLVNFWTQPLETTTVESLSEAVATEEVMTKRLAATEERRGSGEPPGGTRKPWEAISRHSVGLPVALPAALDC